MNLLGIICWIKRRHKWSKPHFEHLGGGVYATIGDRYKTCRRCNLTVPVRSRKAKRGTKFGVLS